MKLSEAIMLGVGLIPEPNGNDVSACAIGMALMASGAHRPETRDDAGIGKAYRAFSRKWPWVIYASYTCPRCPRIMHASQIIWHPFDTHVMIDKNMTIEQLADWVASIEPATPEPTLGRDPEHTHQELCIVKEKV